MIGRPALYRFASSPQSWDFAMHFWHVLSAGGLILQLLCSPIGNQNYPSKTKHNITTEGMTHRVYHHIKGCEARCSPGRHLGFHILAPARAQKVENLTWIPLSSTTKTLHLTTLHLYFNLNFSKSKKLQHLCSSNYTLAHWGMQEHVTNINGMIKINNKRSQFMATNPIFPSRSRVRWASWRATRGWRRGRWTRCTTRCCAASIRRSRRWRG